MPETSTPLKEAVSITMDEDVLTMAREAGLKEGRTLSNWIEKILREEFSTPKTTAAGE